MRIISGSHKGRRITAPKSLPVRPTTDFAKEALLNLLEHRIQLEEVLMLDLFSGTGNLAYEFASRGAHHILAVDIHFGCTRFIHKTAQELELPIKSYKADVFKFLKKPHEQRYALILADPPYDHKALTEIPDLIFNNGWLEPAGIFILEHPDHLNFENHTNFVEHRSYSTVNFSFFKCVTHE